MLTSSLSCVQIADLMNTLPDLSDHHLNILLSVVEKYSQWQWKAVWGGCSARSIFTSRAVEVQKTFYSLSPKRNRLSSQIMSKWASLGAFLSSVLSALHNISQQPEIFNLNFVKVCSVAFCLQLQHIISTSPPRFIQVDSRSSDLRHRNTGLFLDNWSRAILESEDAQYQHILSKLL